MSTFLRSITDSLAWNLFLITFGSALYVMGYNGIAAYHDFVPGGIYGLSVVLQKLEETVPLSRWYFLLNVPLFLAAWKGVSRRFFFLNLYAMGIITVMTAYMHPSLNIQNETYGAIASGAIMGAGCGVILRSYGGGGGLDVIAIMLNRKYGIRFGAFFFFCNAAVMSFALSRYTPDKIIASLIMLFISSVVTEYVLSLFNQRKAVRIITKNPEELVKTMMEAKYPATIFPGKGGYSRQPVDMILSITDNIRLRSLEQLVFDADPDAIFVVENTFSVIGGSIARRKEY